MIPEFYRPFALDAIGAEPRAVGIEATPEERAALAARFGLLGIERLAASANVVGNAAGYVASGRRGRRG